MNRQPHGGPKARHTHTRHTRPAPEPKRAVLPPRPLIVCDGGVLSGLSIRVDAELLAAGLLRIGRGRYTHDRTTDTWIWEDDHA